MVFFLYIFLHELNYLIYVNAFLQYLTFYCIYLPVLKFYHWRLTIKQVERKDEGGGTNRFIE